MPIFGFGSIFEELAETALDANSTSTVTDALDISDNIYVAFMVAAASGAHANHIVTLQCSMDGSAWENTAHTITGTGMLDNLQITAKFVRLKVTTAEGGTSTIDIIIQAK